MQVDLMEAKVSQMRTGEARAAVRDLIAKVRELKEDAERYRWLRSSAYAAVMPSDDYIDAARGESKHG